MLLPSCNTTKFLQDDEVLLTKSEIILEESRENQLTSRQILAFKTEMIQFYKIKPNTNTWYGAPREYIYYRKSKNADSLAMEKLRDSKVAEPPALLDKRLIDATTLDMQNFLRNKKGYYNAVVRDSLIIQGKKANVKYLINTGTRYTIHSLEYESFDTTLIKTIDTISHSSLLKLNDPIDALVFNLEKQRVVTELQNRGYANFNLNYVGIEGDSTDLDEGIDIRFKILKPIDGDVHIKYRIGDIKIYTDYNQFQLIDSLYSEVQHSKEFFRQSSEFLVRPSVIDKKIFLKKYSIYKADDYYKTIRKLYSLDTYRFAKLNTKVSEESDTIIDYRIFLTPQKSRWILDLRTEIFYSNISRADRNLIGIAVGTSLENRNTFKGSETYTLGIESGVEVNVNPQSSNRVITTFTGGINNNLDLPRMTNFLNMIPLLNKVGVVTDKALNRLEEEGTTQINLGYNYIDVLDFYKISSFNTSYGYDFKLDNNNRVVFNQIGLNFTLNNPLVNFEAILDTVPLLKQSFQSAFFSGFFFRDISYYYQGDNDLDGINYAFISNLEVSGLEIHAANRLYNVISGSSSIWDVKDQTDFAKFVKLDIDNRWYRNIKKNAQIAWRIRAGVAIPYGETGVVSWLKQFSVGGPNSLRAWRPMEIGPGSYRYPDDNARNFFQRGDILLEFGVDYRFDIFWLVEGGLFFDGGNIWTLKTDGSRPGSKISSDFLSQIALGYGYGLRFDFTYFLIRFDFGFKLKNPSRRSDTGRLWEPLRGQKWYGNPNVAVNYPF